MTWKKLSKSSPGDSSTFGANDLDKVSDLFSGTADVDTVDINSTFKVRDQKLRIANSGNTQVHIISSAAASTDKTWTLPNVTDTAVGKTTTDTLTNKTLTSPVISTIVNTGTLTLPTSTDTLVGRATTDTLTNKTLTTPVISSISNTGTLTLPTSTDTLIGKATTDTLTNKTLDANDTGNYLPSIQTTPDVRIIGGWWGGTVTTGIGFTAGVITNTAPTNTFTNSATDGKYRAMTSGATAGNVAGHKVNDAQGAVFRAIKPRFKAKFRCTDVTNCRVFVGLTNQGGTGGSATYSTGDDPFAGPLAGIALQYRSSTDTNFQIGRNDTSGATVFVDTGVTPASNSGIHTIEIKTDNIQSASAATGFMWSLDGGAFSSVLTTDIPAAGTPLYCQVNIETSTTAGKPMDLWYWYIVAQNNAV